MRRLTYKLHGCALSTETKACVPLISMALSMAVIAFRGKDKRSTEPCLRFARALQLNFFPLLVQPATGERYAPLQSCQHFSAMGSDPIETCRFLGCIGACAGVDGFLPAWSTACENEVHQIVAAEWVALYYRLYDWSCPIFFVQGTNNRTLFYRLV